MWDGADVLAYYGAVLSAVGTAILGYYSYKQNQSMLKIEQERFITENSSMIFLNSLYLKSRVNFTAIPHPEQILATTNCKKSNSMYISLKFFCKVLFGFPILIHIDKLNLTIIDSQSRSKSLCLHCYNSYYEYSPITLSHNQMIYTCSILLSNDEFKDIQSFIKSKKYKIIIDMTVSLLNVKYVESKWECKGSFKRQQSEVKNNDAIFRIINKGAAQCTWLESRKVAISSVKIKSDICEEETNAVSENENNSTNSLS